MSPAVAFMSYVRFDDQHENGRLTELSQRLSSEVGLQTGSEFRIFHRNDVAWVSNGRSASMSRAMRSPFSSRSSHPVFSKAEPAAVNSNVFSIAKST
jgi:hypothetical protein